MLFLCKDLRASLCVSMETTPGSCPGHSDKTPDVCKSGSNLHPWLLGGGARCHIATEITGRKSLHPSSWWWGGRLNFENYEHQLSLGIVLNSGDNMVTETWLLLFRNVKTWESSVWRRELEAAPEQV